ncbi:hypothetical protein ABI59_17130 [Acidobacteria bacterium Mor1]|nr:hypothetical protein ABI59_17130 [Acidobacteria bacterium Mor1]
MNVMLEVDGKMHRVELSDESPLLDVGRLPQNHITLHEPSSISGRHLTIRWSDGWWVQDSSTNGTRVNGSWFRGSAVALDVDSVLEVEGHVLIVHDLPVPVSEATDRARSLLLLALNDGVVKLHAGQGEVIAAIPPQQYNLLRELVMRWRGLEFGSVDREQEFALLGSLEAGADPNVRLHQCRCRLRKWWRELRKTEPRALQGLPRDLLEVQAGGVRLTLEAAAVDVESYELERPQRG